MDELRKAVVMQRLEGLSQRVHEITDSFFQELTEELPNVTEGTKSVHEAISNAVAPAQMDAVAIMSLEMAAQDILREAQAAGRPEPPNLEYIDGLCYGIEKVLYHREEVKKYRLEEENEPNEQ